MAWTTQIAKQVSSGIQERGRQYYRSGAVRIASGDDWEVDATVQGGARYEVFLAREDNTILASCTCPYYEDNFAVCKHIWATVLAADEGGYLRGTGASVPRRLEIDEDFEDEGREDDYEGEEWDEDDGPRVYAPPPPAPPRSQAKTKPRKRSPDWKKSLTGLRAGMEKEEAPSQQRDPWPPGRQLVYIVDAQASRDAQGLVIEVAHRQRKKDGDWSKPKGEHLSRGQIARLPDPADQQVLASLGGAEQYNGYSGFGYYSSSYYGYDSIAFRYRLSGPQQDLLFPLMCKTGRCLLRRDANAPELRELRWDDAGPWEFWLVVTPDDKGKKYQLAGELRRGAEHLGLDAPLLLVSGGLVFWDDRVAPLEDFGAFSWVVHLRKNNTLTIPAGQKDDLLKELLALPHLPRTDLPEDLRFEEVHVTPRPRLKVKPPTKSPYFYGQQRLPGELSFDYDGTVVHADQAGRGVYQPESRRLILRDRAAEQEAAAKLQQLGFRPVRSYYGRPPQGLELAPRNLPKVVRTLLGENWHVEAEGKLYRQPGNIKIEVSSGIDWFELDGKVQFGDTEASLPELLAALRRGADTVQLGDGTFGMLPQEWLKKYGLLAGLGKVEGDRLRFRRSQVGLLDALLASQPEATWDEAFTRARDELRQFEGIQPADPPAGFVGQLREYQRDGLGWLYFLQKFGFGGCLADDMGLGKTVQVLALLESRRELRAREGADRPAPSLVVVPRSLVFNWQEEAARFTPKLRVLDHTGIGRGKPGPHFHDYDLVVTTYGTLRRDALDFKDLSFDYCILDESQSIKNASSESAKAARLLRADHRLALSGTPIENHLGELWSLFEYLNPGMLGTASVFQLTGAGARNPSEETRALLARALRPFILRRTKQQVAKDLPEKLEQTIHCELDAAQRKLYDELLNHYRAALLPRVEKEGINKSKIQILEALLRLRQAACHPGLIDKAKASQPSAKLDALLPQLAEVFDEGHKVLVFSQFTSLLAIVRDRLDKEKIPYEYLDGRTRDRAARVERFQNDPECKLFLVSLKAGGLGLNLTAAEYVFLLDPWWNPAVEAQAIDRAHRIGQTRPVFAYRLIAKDTVEEKVLQLQQSKRDLADAIINADNSLIRNLGREDLELLLS